ncbi:FkbM family methyltransferase, partial [Candidatus Pseudothioglobus singularis]|nr:FkbM family methyltransferase [Candidatus Pseudothioglobus singularis]
ESKPAGCAIFKNGEYDLIPKSDREVLDIGAAHGDTAIFFSLRGARKVYGYELQGENCILAKKNIKLNNLNNIKIFHCGVASKKINSSDNILGAILQNDERNMIDSADFKTLDEIAKLHGIKNAVLKLDVDGFEYEILRSTSVGTLSKFDYIFIEYHFGVQDLNSILINSGFYCQSEEVSTINADWHPQEFRSMNVGYIFATNKSMQI